MLESKLEILESKCNALENIVKELVNLEVDQSTNTKNWILVGILYISLATIVSAAIMEIFNVVAIIVEYIAVHYEIIEPAMHSKDMEVVLEFSACISIPIFIILLTYPLLVLFSQTFSIIHPKWGLRSREYLVFLGTFLVIGIIFIWLSISADYPTKEVYSTVHNDQELVFLLKHLSNNAYLISFSMTYLAVCITLLYVNKGASQVYKNKYTKLKEALVKISVL